AGTTPRSPISRIERFGLGISKVDYFEIALGLEAPLKKLQPFIEYSIDIPVNRQGWACVTSRISRGDVCLGLEDLSSVTPTNREGDGGVGFAYVPSRFSLGVRVDPFEKSFRGLSGVLAFDIGTGAVSSFAEEIVPQAPWTLYLGLGYAYDTKEK